MVEQIYLEQTDSQILGPTYRAAQTTESFQKALHAFWEPGLHTWTLEPLEAPCRLSSVLI